MTQKMKKIVLIGAGGLSIQLLSWMSSDNEKFKIVGIFDDNQTFSKKMVKLKNMKVNKNIFYYLTVNDPFLRKRIYLNLKKKNKDLKFSNYFHSTALINNKKKISKNEGLIVGPNCLIEDKVEIGKCNILNANSSLFHEVKTGNFCTFAPYSSCLGKSKINDCVLIGAHANVNPNIKIKKNIVIGSHANVVKNLSYSGIYAGNPSIKIKNLY